MDDGDGSVRGEFAQYVATHRDGTSSKLYAIKTAEGRKIELTFNERPKLEPGDSIRVWGSERQGTFVVERYEIDAPPASGVGVARSALVDAPPEAPRTFAFVLVTLNGVAPTDLTPAQAEADVISGSDSFVRYYLETSYGIQPFTAEIFSGPNFSHTMSSCSFDDTDEMADALRDQVEATSGKTFDHYGFYFEGNNGCGWSGLGQVGRPSNAAEDSWYNGSSSCVVLAQEVGHNLGQSHSSAIDCGSVSLADNPSTCRHLEYGDRFDVMGGGCYHWTMYHKVHWNWARQCNSVRVTSSGTFDVFPIETPCDGIQTLQIPMPAPRVFPADGDSVAAEYYYVEYRQPVGNFSAARGTLHQGVLIHAGSDYRLPNQRGERPFLLDMTPGSGNNDRTEFEDAALTTGMTFTDPSGSPRITLVSRTAEKATVQVEITGGSGNPTCLDGMELAAPGPQTCTEPPQPPMGGTGGTGTVGAGGTDGTATGGVGGSGVGGAGGASAGASAGGSAGASAGGGTGVGGGTSSGGAFSTGGASTVPGGGPGVSAGGSTAPGLTSDGDDAPGEVTGQCACRVPGQEPGRGGNSLRDGLALLAVLAMVRRRRKT